jgi:hypothetical protein
MAIKTPASAETGRFHQFAFADDQKNKFPVPSGNSPLPISFLTAFCKPAVMAGAIILHSMMPDHDQL